MPAVQDPRDLGDTGVPSLLLVRRVDDCPRHRVILLAGYDQQRPRSELLLLTFASVHGLRLALAAWNSGAPGAATWNVSCSCFASSSLRAFAQPYLNCSAECDGTVPVGGVPEHRRGGLQRGNRQRK